MKYTISETDGVYELLRHGEPAGRPNNAELEFWLRIQELEAKIEEMEWEEKLADRRE